MDNLRLHGIAVYNPGLWSREELKAYFVARQELLEHILAALQQQRADAPCQHRLLLGLRGMGKSTLLRRIALAVEEDAELNQCWLPLTFPEEQYNISTAADLWRNCLDAFCDLIEEREGKAQADALDEALHGLADDEVFSRLLAEADARNRRLLLLIDNIDLILERLKKEEPELRRVLRSEPRLLLIGASAQQEVKADFFSATDKLAGLSLAEMQAMLTRLVEQELAQKKTPEPPVAEHPVLVLLRDDPARIKTLHTLTGGNLLLSTLLYNAITKTDSDIWNNLKLLVNLTIAPEYKIKFEELPVQAQQVMDRLISNFDPMTARQLSDKLKWDVNIISSQLNRMQQYGLVEKVKPAKGGRTAFQVGDRFFSIWYLMRGSRRVRRKLTWMIYFMQLFLDDNQLQLLLNKFESKAKAVQLLKESNDASVITECLNTLGAEAKDEARIILKEYKDPSVLVTCLKILGDEAKEYARQLLKENSDLSVISQCLSILSIEAKDEARILLQQYKNTYISVACLKILGEEAKEYAGRLLDSGLHPYIVKVFLSSNQWQEAEPHIRTLLAKGDDEFFEKNWQDMLALFKEACRTGKAAEALALLDESPLAERWRPLREALAAAAEGTVRYLNGVAPEVREPALAILKDIAPDVLPSP